MKIIFNLDLGKTYISFKIKKFEQLSSDFLILKQYLYKTNIKIYNILVTIKKDGE